MNKYPESSIPNIQSLDPAVWADESFQVASHFAYAGLHENQELSQAYLDKVRPMAE